MNIDLDIAATISAVFWPVVVLLMLIMYRKTIPALVATLANRLNKLEFGGVSLELAVAKPFEPVWAGTGNALDLRNKAAALQVNDSTAGTFLSQLREKGSADYAVADLGAGEEWLTSRLFIMAIVFARMKGVRCFVFVETVGANEKRFVGWAEPEKIRWALAKHYPWLEQAFADAYAEVMRQGEIVVISKQGRLGLKSSPRDPGSSVKLLQEFLQRIQTIILPPSPKENFVDQVLIEQATNTYEHANWVDNGLLEDILGADFVRSYIRIPDPKSKVAAEQLQKFMNESGKFVAVTGDDKKFEYLVDRSYLLDQLEI